METYWQTRTEMPVFPSLSGDLDTDVLVIGGGLAGLLIAHELTQKGVKTVLVEKARICSGTTAGTTAKATAQHGLLYHRIAKSLGEEAAGMYYHGNREAVEKLKTLCHVAGCAFEKKDNFVYSADLRTLERELEALEKLRIPAIFTRRLPIPVDCAGAVGFEQQGQMDVLGLGAYLARKLLIFEQTKVLALEGATAVTNRGRIRAERIVVATHFPMVNKHGSYFLKLYQHRSYLLALKNAPALDAMYVDDSKTGMSFSSFGDVLLLGGGGHRTGKQGGSCTELRRFRQQRYPEATEILHWGAQDTMSLDGIPYIGRYSARTENLYVAAGFNKWGMTGAMVSAEILGGMLTGEAPAYAPVFSPSRSILRQQLFVNGAEATVSLLSPTTRRCPHLGCALKYNREEHSWDCPCHGSRFSEGGKLLNNPANGDLRSAD